MYGYGPCQAEWILFESSLHLSFYLFCLFIQGVFGVLPGLCFNIKGLFVTRAKNADFLIVYVGDVSNASVIVSSNVIITDKHHLCPNL